MAAFAHVGCRYVIRRFARGQQTIMTTQTGTEHRGMIEIQCLHPGITVCTMADVTFRCRGYMLDIFSLGNPAVAMATAAFRRRTAKYSEKVTGFTANRGMGTDQWKTGDEMIEA